MPKLSGRRDERAVVGGVIRGGGSPLEAKRDYFMNANEALEYGLVDKIIEAKIIAAPTK